MKPVMKKIEIIEVLQIAHRHGFPDHLINAGAALLVEAADGVAGRVVKNPREKLTMAELAKLEEAFASLADALRRAQNGERA